jgi:hypothetical protein
MRFCTVIAAALVAAAAARAGSLTDEVVVNSTQASGSNPRTGSAGDLLRANFELTPRWGLTAGAMLTFEGQTQGTAREFGTSSSTVSLFSLGADFLANEHWTLGATFSGSPQSTLLAGTSFTGPNPSGTQVAVDALVRSQTSEIAGTLDAAYDTAGDSDLEWSFGGTVNFTHLGTSQTITEARFANTAQDVTPAQIKAICARNGKRCVQGLLTALDETPANLDSERFSATATATVRRDTDVTLSFDWYHYEEDPAEIGFFSLVEAGHAGLGVPIAPLQFLVKPEVQHRFGDLSLRLWVQAGRYEPGTGDNTAGIGLRAQYRFSKAFRIWLTASGQRDVDEAGEATRSGGLALGFGYRW